VKSYLIIGASLSMMVCSGCGESGPEVASVEGTVKLDGQPLPDATVMFIPENGRPAAAMTDAGGHYVLTFTEGRKGAMPGKHKVRITTFREADESEEIEGQPEKVPMKYNAQTTLEFEVEAGKKNIADFDLDSAGELPPTSG
jgi:hypothetical protein